MAWRRTSTLDGQLGQSQTGKIWGVRLKADITVPGNPDRLHFFPLG